MKKFAAVVGVICVSELFQPWCAAPLLSCGQSPICTRAVAGAASETTSTTDDKAANMPVVGRSIFRTIPPR
jgi:hypothetical protein